MSTENDCKEQPVEDISVEIKPRLSLFKPNLPAGSTDAERKAPDNKCLSEYCDKLLLESELWKKIYKDLKNLNRCLRKDLNENVNDAIHFNILSEEDMEYERSRPNFCHFMEQVNNLQNHAQVVEIDFNKLRCQKGIQLKNLQLEISLVEQECCKHDDNFIS